MGTTPTWQAATAGQLPKADHVNQFLGTHTVQLIYHGNVHDEQIVDGGSAVGTGTYLAQSFTTGVSQTDIGRIVLQFAISSGGVPTNVPPSSFSIQGDSGGQPDGTPLVTVNFSPEYIFNGPALITFPTPITGLSSSTTYWIVTPTAINGSYQYAWEKSDQVSGASTSSDGITWTPQSYGFVYEIFDQTVRLELNCLWEDNGARWTWFNYTSLGRFDVIAEYTSGQTSTGYSQSYRTFTYSNDQLAQIS